MEWIRDSFTGQMIRLVTNNRVLLYPEEREGFSWAPLDELLEKEKEQPAPRASAEFHDEGIDRPLEAVDESSSDASVRGDKEGDVDKELHHFAPITKIPTAADTLGRTRTMGSQMSRTATRVYTKERFDEEQAARAEKTKSTVIAPTKTADGVILVDWYTTDDPANPQNWNGTKKFFTLAMMFAYVMGVYASSSMYAPGVEQIAERFNVSIIASSIGLAIFVVGYGIGPMLWAPLSEIPAVGRNWVYAPTFALFVILSFPTAVVDNYSGLMILRLLTGFFGSPVLANGGASIGDMYGLLELPMYLAAWTVAAFFGPAVGPLIAGFAVDAKGWRWGLWEIVWLNGPVLIIFLLFYPETSADYLLKQRAQRLRKLTGNSNIKSQSEINQAEMNAKEVVWDALIKPVEIMIKDPAVLFANVYTSLLYGIYYSFFEVFPLVYAPIYGFNIGEIGIVFFATISIGCLTFLAAFLAYQKYVLIPDIKANGLGEPERRLIPALFGVFIVPAALFLFGWTARESIHWIVTMIGITLTVGANFWIFQSVFIYLPLSYPRYAASLFAANDLSRSGFAAGAVVFSRPMYLNLGIGKGVSVMAGLSVLGIFGTFYLWKYGAWLRSKSSFAQAS